MNYLEQEKVNLRMQGLAPMPELAPLPVEGLNASAMASAEGDLNMLVGSNGTVMKGWSKDSRRGNSLVRVVKRILKAIGL